jgi:hypothetical protein
VGNRILAERDPKKSGLSAALIMSSIYLNPGRREIKYKLRISVFQEYKYG